MTNIYSKIQRKGAPVTPTLWPDIRHTWYQQQYGRKWREDKSTSDEGEIQKENS